MKTIYVLREIRSPNHPITPNAVVISIGYNPPIQDGYTTFNMRKSFKTTLKPRELLDALESKIALTHIYLKKQI